MNRNLYLTESYNKAQFYPLVTFNHKNDFILIPCIIRHGIWLESLHKLFPDGLDMDANWNKYKNQASQQNRVLQGRW